MLLTKRTIKILAFLSLVSCRTVSPRATSDLRGKNVDRKSKIAESVANLTDLFAFPSPRRPGHLVLALNITPFSKDLPYFSEQVNYIFYLREIKLSKPGEPFKLAVKERGEKTIMCWFRTPDDPQKQAGTCVLSSLGEVSSRYGEKSTAGDVWFYHGLRKDPFFFASKLPAKLAEVSKKISVEKIASTGPQNVLSVILEFDPKKLFGREVVLLGVAAQSYTSSNDGRFKALSRIGRPDIANLLFSSVDSKDDLRSRYLLGRPFEMSDVEKILYKERIVDQISRYDQFDKTNDWDERGKQNLADVLLGDYILFDTTKFKADARYLDVEQSALAGKGHETFGGRGMQDDTINQMFELLINRSRNPISSTVRAPAAGRKLEFPYFEDHDSTWRGAGSANQTRMSLGL